MKKLIAILLTISCAALAVEYATLNSDITTENARIAGRTAHDASLVVAETNTPHKIIIQGAFTNTLSSTLSQIVEDGALAVFLDNSTSFAATATNVTAAYTGTATVRITGSFTADGAMAPCTGHIFIDGADTGIGFSRSVSAAAAYGSFALGWSGAVTSGTTIDLRLSDNTGDNNLQMHDFHMEVVRN